MEKIKIARIAGKSLERSIAASGRMAYHIHYDNGDNSTTDYSFVVEKGRSPYEWMRENATALSGYKVSRLMAEMGETGKAYAAVTVKEGNPDTDFYWGFRATGALRDGLPEVWGGCPQNVWLNFE